jgi:aquaporin Z
MVTAQASTGAIASSEGGDAPVRGLQAPVRYSFEAIGTFSMVLAVGAAVQSGTPLAIMGIGAVQLAMVCAGGHYNPAVTLAMLVRRRIGLDEAIAYWCVQFGAGLVAAALIRTIVDPTRAAATAAITLSGHTLVAAFAVELVVVFLWCYLATGEDAGHDSLYGLAIGFTTVTAAFAVGAIACDAINPTVSLGVAVMLSLCLVAQVLGGVTAGVTLLASNPTKG